MSAQIRISVERGGVIISTNVNQSVDNVRKGDVVYCESVDVHTTYSWTLVFTPDSPNGTVSSSGLINPPGSTANNCKFIVDNEGAYLVRLVVDAGLGTESTQFLRIRKITRFGDIKLVAAGERKDSVGAIPFDIDPVGWADDQNQNLQKLLAYVRRLSTSGRVLYVDANRGRKAYDSTQNANDFTNTLEMPGADLSALTVSGVVTDAEGFADFSDISSAITYAGDCATRGETALSSDHPYVILVQNGLYIEDVNLAPNIHIVSADNFFTTDNTYAKGVVIRSTNVTGGHTFVGTNNTDSVVCVGVEFENTDGASTNPTFKVQKGSTHFVNCTISHKSGTGGSALSVIPVDHTTTDECQAHLINSYVQNTVVSATDYAIKSGSAKAYLVLENSTVVGQNGIQSNADYGGGLKEEVHLHIVRSTVMANNASGYAVISNASDLKVEHSYISSSDSAKVLVIGENLPKTGDVIAKLSFSEFHNAQITFDTRQIAGSKMLKSSSCIYSGYVFPDTAPTFTAETQAKSLKYENNYLDPFLASPALAVPVPNQLGATDVQDAIDDLTFLSAIIGAFGTFNSLDVAYDGVISVNPPALGSGSGRKIAADQGAVVIQSATSPYVTTPISGTETTALTSADKNGYLQVEGNLEVGKVDSAEIELITNYGTIGSMLSLGSVTWNSEIASVASGVDHRSLPSGIIQGNSDKDGLLHNYNLRLQTKSTKSVSNGSVGWVVLQGGDSLDKGPSVPGPHAGDVYIQGGSYLGTASSIGDNCPAGSVYLIPGTSTGVGTDEPYGYVKLINPSASTSATLVASAGSSNPTTVAGEISWTTPMGVVTATITIGMTLADVVDAINNATVGAGLIFAQQSSGFITLTCVSKGELSDVVYVGDSVGGNLNTDLGDFQISSGATFAAGADPQYVNIHSSALHEITIGEGGAVGSMIYNSETGKLTVPGLIDPTGMIFSEENQSNVPTGANEGAIFVSDGSGGLIANKIYYKPANNGTPVDLTAGGGGGGLTNWSEDGSGNLYPNTTDTQDLGSSTNAIKTIYLKDDTGITFTDGTSNSTLDVLDLSGSPTLQFNGVSLLTTTAVSSKIELSDLSVTTNAASGSGALSYDNTTGVFDFTPADVSGGSTFTNWSEDIAKNFVTSSSNNIGSPSSGIGNIYLAPTKSVHWTDASDQIWSISPTITGTGGDPNIITFLTKNTLSNPTVDGEGISYHYQLKNVAGNIGVLGFHNILVADSGTNLSGGYSGMQEFWVAENVTATKYLTLDGRNTSVIFNKVPTLYKDTTVNLNAYSNLVDGMIAYDTTTNNFVGYSTGSWINLSGGGGYGSSTNPLTYVVTVAVKTTVHPYYGMPSIPSNAYFLDGVESPAIRLRGADSSKPYYYRFDQSDASNTGHQINFYLTADNTGVAYTTGVTTNGIAGNPGAYTQIAVDEDTPNILYYQCTVHQYMGNHFTTISNTFNDSGTLVTVSSLGGGGGGLSGTGANGTVGVFDGGAINGGSALTFNSAAHSLFIDSSDVAFGSFTHYSNSGDGTKNWIVGRSHDGSLLLRTQSVYNATFNESDYDTGWSIDSTGNLLPTGTSILDIGSTTNRVQSIYVDATSSVHYIHEESGSTYDWALSVDAADLTKPKLTFNGATIGGDYAVVSQHSIATKYGSDTNPLVYKVTVDTKTQNHPYDGVSGGSPSAYFLDGIESPAIRFSGADDGDGSYYYRFDQSDNSNNGHPLRFYLSANKTTAYTTGVSVVGTAGQAGSYVQIEVNEDTPNILYYQCSAHSLMGNHATTISNTFNNSGTLVTVDDLVAGGGATDKIIEGDTSVEVADSGSNGVIIFETEGSEKWRIRTAGHLVPQGTTGTLNIGQADQRVNEIYGQSSMFHYQDLAFNSLYTQLGCVGTGALLGRLAQVVNGGAIEVIATHNDTLADFGSTNFFDDHLIPTTNGTLDIGTATNKVRDLYLSESSIKFVNASDTEFALGVDATGKLVYEGEQLLPNALMKNESAIVVSTNNSIAIQTNDVVTWGFSNTGVFTPMSDDYDIGSAGGNEVKNLFVRNLVPSAETIVSRTLADSTNKIRLESIEPADVSEAGLTKDLLVHNVVKETWRGSNADDRADDVLPMFVYHPENLITIKPNNMFLTTIEGFQPGGSTSKDIIYQDELEYLNTSALYADGQGIYCNGSYVPFRRVYLKSNSDVSGVASRGLGAGLKFQCSEYLSSGVRGFGYGSFSSLTSGLGYNGKTDILSFFVTNKGIRTDTSALNGVSNLNGVRATVLATVWNGTNWIQQTIVSEQECVRHNNNVAESDNQNGQVLSLRVDQPPRLFNPEHRYGQVVVIIKAFFDGEGEGDGTAGARHYIAISDVRLHAFGNS